MRTRWMAVAIGASIPVAFTAATVAQKTYIPGKFQLPTAPAEPKRWRTPADPPTQGRVPRPGEALPPAYPADPSTPPTPPDLAAADDPMANVDAFLRRNRKEADDSIRALTREAEELRNRLAKVEAALARWQEVSHSLGTAPAGSPPTAVNPPTPREGPSITLPSSGYLTPTEGPPTPTQLEPIPATSPDPVKPPSIPTETIPAVPPPPR